MSVISLKPTALEEALDRSAIVLAHAPWCGYCTRFMPTYEKFAEEAAGSLPGVLVTRINFDKHGDEVRQRNIGKHMVKGGIGAYVKSFPTVLFVYNGQVSKYNGERTKAGLEEGYKSFQAEVNAGRGDEELLSVDEPVSSASAAQELSPNGLETAVQGNSFVMLYAPWCRYCKEAMQPLDETAQNLSTADISVSKVDFEKYGKEITARRIGVGTLGQKGYEHGISSVVRSFPTLLMFSGGEVAKYTGPRTPAHMSKAMAEFVQKFHK
jgi:thiol-disulfide isomerase/thioredoxin